MVEAKRFRRRAKPRTQQEQQWLSQALAVTKGNVKNHELTNGAGVSARGRETSAVPRGLILSMAKLEQILLEATEQLV